MTRTPLGWALAAVLFTSCLVPGTTTYLGFSTEVAGAPPPPGEVVTEPAVTSAEGGVYVVSDPSVGYDMFRFGAAWYVYSGGYWYRGPSYRGPFAVVEVRRVPRPVLTLPPDRWKSPHRYGRPPGHENDRERRRGHDDDDRPSGR